MLAIVPLAGSVGKGCGSAVCPDEAAITTLPMCSSSAGGCTRQLSRRVLAAESTAACPSAALAIASGEDLGQLLARSIGSGALPPTSRRLGVGTSGSAHRPLSARRSTAAEAPANSHADVECDGCKSKDMP